MLSGYSQVPEHIANYSVLICNKLQLQNNKTDYKLEPSSSLSLSTVTSSHVPYESLGTNSVYIVL